jgi:flagellin
LAFPAPVTLQSGDRRGVAAGLTEARDQVIQLAGDLDQLDVAGAGLAQVQGLVGRLRNIAVVALDGTIPPAQRAALQRQVDEMLGEIDTVANGTRVDEGLLGGGASSAGVSSASGSDGAQPGSFRAIGTAMLGLAGLAVRSSDQALAATGALDVATARLQRGGRALSSTTARLQETFQGLTGGPTIAMGDAALGEESDALASAALLRARLLASPELAVEAQTSELDARRVRRLLDAP